MCWRSKFKNFLKFYEGDFGQISMKTLESELDLWEEHWCQSKTCLPDSVSTTLKSINFPCFPIIKTALRILGTLPVTSCSCERSFSALCKLKMYNRSTMWNGRLSALLYIHVEIDPDPVYFRDTYCPRAKPIRTWVVRSVILFCFGFVLFLLVETDLIL